MPHSTFQLTVRRADLFELYSDQTNFKLFSKPYAGRLFFIAVALLLGGITLVASFYNSKYVFYALLFGAGIVYCVYDIWKMYRIKKEKQASVEAWIKGIEQFKSHQLSLHEEAIVYQRDAEVYTYAWKDMITHSGELYYRILLISNSDELLLPKKAFSTGDYEQFAQAVETKLKEIRN